MSEFIPGELKRNEALQMIAKAEDMIRRFRDMDYVLKPEARTLFFGSRLRKEKQVLSDELWKSFAVFEDAKCKYPSSEDMSDIAMRYNLSHICLLLIDRALTSGVVEEGQGLVRKLRQSKDRITELESDLAKVTEENLLLQRGQFSQGKDDERKDEGLLGDLGA